jgi:hypothetical protein
MTPDFMALFFMALNAIRALAYLPQIIAVWRDKRRANAVSIATWSLFTITNAMTVVYVELRLHDRMLAAFFALNALCCLLIVVVTAWKRVRNRNPAARAESLLRRERLTGKIQVL